MQDAFELFEDDQHRLDYHSLKCALRALGAEVRKRDVLQIMERHDPMEMGCITWKEFSLIAQQFVLARDPKEELSRAFELLDSDQTGQISLRNLRLWAKQVEAPFTDNYLQVMDFCPLQMRRAKAESTVPC